MSRRSGSNPALPKIDHEVEAAHTSLSASASASIGSFPVLQVFVQSVKGSSRPQLVIQPADIPDGEGEAITRALLSVLPQAIANAASSAGVSVKGAVQKVKKPPNSFMMFSNKLRPLILSQNRNLSNAEVSKILGSRWKSLSPEEKQVYVSAADHVKHSRKNNELFEGSEAKKQRKSFEPELPVTQPVPEKNADQVTAIPLPAIPIPLSGPSQAYPSALPAPCVHTELCPAPCANTADDIFAGGEFDFDGLDELLALPDANF